MPVLTELACPLFYFVMVIQVSEIYLPIIRTVLVEARAQKRQDQLMPVPLQISLVYGIWYRDISILASTSRSS